jgi:hypothetical protein
MEAAPITTTTTPSAEATMAEATPTTTTTTMADAMETEAPAQQQEEEPQASEEHALRHAKPRFDYTIGKRRACAIWGVARLLKKKTSAGRVRHVLCCPLRLCVIGAKRAGSRPLELLPGSWGGGGGGGEGRFDQL